MTTKTKTVTFRQQDLRQYLIDFRDREDVKDGSFDGTKSYVHKPSDGGEVIGLEWEIQGICNLMDSWIDYEWLRQTDVPLPEIEGDNVEGLFPSVDDWPLASGCDSFPIAIGDVYPGKQYDANRYEPFADNEYCYLRRRLLDWCIEWLEGKDGEVFWD